MCAGNSGSIYPTTHQPTIPFPTGGPGSLWRFRCGSSPSDFSPRNERFIYLHLIVFLFSHHFPFSKVFSCSWSSSSSSPVACLRGPTNRPTGRVEAAAAAAIGYGGSGREGEGPAPPLRDPRLHHLRRYDFSSPTAAAPPPFFIPLPLSLLLFGAADSVASVGSRGSCSLVRAVIRSGFGVAVT